MQHAMMSLQPGDTLNVEPGKYAGFIVGWDSVPASSGDPLGTISGTASAPITIQADPSAPQGSVIINSSNSQTAVGIDLEPGDNYIKISGFTINSNGSITRDGIKATGNNDRITNNTVSGVGGQGIFANNAANAVIQGNTVFGTTGTSTTGHGIYITGDTDGAVVKGNVIYSNGYIGIHVNGSGGTTGVLTNALIADNIIYNNGQNGINCDGIQSSTIENNLIYGYQGYGICLYRSDASGPSKNNIIVNNTIVSTQSGAGAAVRILDGGTGNTVLNNILLGGGNVALRISNDSRPGLVSNYNVFGSLFQSEDTGNTETLAQWQTESGQDLKSFTATPAGLFVNAAGNNYQLSSTSPAIDASTSTDAPATDLLGNPRPSGKGFDIGAYEYQQTKSQSSTTTAVSASPTSSVFGQTLTLTATVTPNGAGTPTGTITFKEGSTVLGTATLSSGTASITTSALSVGSDAITATYSGDTNFTGSSGNTSETVNQDGTSTSVTATPTSSVFGQSVTFTTSVSPSAPGAGKPTGTVTFKAGSTILGTATLSSGSASITTSALAVGSDSITATYSGDTNFTTSSGSTTEAVKQDASTTSVTASPTSSVSGQAVTFTATVSASSPGSGTPTGTVTFEDGSTILGTGTLSSGNASFTTSSLSLGSHTITAIYNGDSNFTTSSGSAIETVNQGGATTTMVSASPASSVFGQSVSFTATVTPNGAGTPTGTVTFKEGSTVLGTATLSSGTASITTSALSLGSDTITATYSGDANFTGSSGGTSETVNQDGTSTSVTATPTSSVFGQSVTFTASVSPNAPGAGKPTGTVTFKAGSTILGTATLSSGSASITTSALAVGSDSITATYSGDTNFAGSFGSTTETVKQDASTTSVTASRSSSNSGQAVTFTATVSASSPGSGTPTGTVTFKDGSTILGTGTLSSGSASFTTSSLSAGSHTITAIYNGDGNFTTSSGSATENVNQGGATTTMVSANPASSVYGESVSFTATVTANVASSGTPAGSVTFRQGSTVLGTATLNSNGRATLTSSRLPAGTDTVTATYNGSTTFASSSDSTIETVSKDGSTTTVSEGPTNPVFGEMLYFTATVYGSAHTSGTPTGTVTFTEGSTVLATVALTNGSAKFRYSSLSVGANTITATYSGDSNYIPCFGSLTDPVAQDATSTVLVTSATRSAFGQSVTFTARVSAKYPGSGTPNGSVTFEDGSTILGTAMLNSLGQATFTTSNLAVGTHNIVAIYGDDSQFLSSTSMGLKQVVVKDATTTAVVSSLNPSTVGQAVTFTATVSAKAPGAGTATGTATFLDGSTILGTVALDSLAQAVFTISSFSVGKHNITVVYSGDSDFVGNTSAILTQTVNA
jgi:hypothetical protein